MQIIWKSALIRILVVASLSVSGMLTPTVQASGAITLPPKGVSQELWKAFQEVVISNVDGADRNLRWNTAPTFYIAGDPTFEDNSTFRDTLSEIGQYCNNIRPSISTIEPREGALFHYSAPEKFKSIIPETPADVTTSYSWSLYYLNRGLTKFTSVFSNKMSQSDRNRDTQIRILQGMGLRGKTSNINARIFSWAYPYANSQRASELDKQIIRLYCSTYTRSWDTAQETFDAISTAWTKKVNVPSLNLNVKVEEYKNQLNFVFNFDPSGALQSQLSGIEYRILDISGNVVKSDTLEVTSNLFKTYSVVLSGIKDSSRYKIEAYPLNSLGKGSIAKGEGRSGSQQPPSDSYQSASDTSAEILDARKAASDAINAGNETLALFGRYKDECLEVSTQFETEAQELYDTTSLNTYCGLLDESVSGLEARIGALDADKATTTDQANELTDKANDYAEEADELVALIQDITEELLATEKQLLTIVKLLDPLNIAETEIVDAWDTLAERIALLPKTSQTSIKKSSNYKSALSIQAQVVKAIASKDTVLDDLGSLEDPRKLSGLVSQLSRLKISAPQSSTFKKSLVALNNGIPSKVCIKGALNLLPSRSGKCPPGYEQIPTQ